ncbi:hypothetical protein QR680_006441 [Steinernema hermaphroditum]|uniref:Uncharacterized protein n=1 Tax=Steinernema hermaphroditum TaxID=289476 RepID=A0AA39HVF5_9BILA|nr:hypothetical protein QR680_006441 [Steinernema hermaphroditum]
MPSFTDSVLADIIGMCDSKTAFVATRQVSRRFCDMSSKHGPKHTLSMELSPKRKVRIVPTNEKSGISVQEVDKEFPLCFAEEMLSMIPSFFAITELALYVDDHNVERILKVMTREKELFQVRKLDINAVSCCFEKLKPLVEYFGNQEISLAASVNLKFRLQQFFALLRNSKFDINRLSVIVANRQEAKEFLSLYKLCSPIMPSTESLCEVHVQEIKQSTTYFRLADLPKQELPLGLRDKYMVDVKLCVTEDWRHQFIQIHTVTKVHQRRQEIEKLKAGFVPVRRRVTRFLSKSCCN